MIVTTTLGKAEGVLLPGAFVFRGIPYGEPPIGRLRFKPPLPAAAWEGVRRCDRFGPIAPQRHDPQGFMPELEQSEDCLNLNVWTPGADGPLRPVMVYIHGGGFTSGKGAECDGLRYAAEDGIVYVSINYRLGALGFLYLGEVLGEGYKTSGNNGMLDIVEALRWVQANIVAFGGDPQQVTVVGNSAGAKITSTLYAMETAQGLFHRAIAQSGATQSIRGKETASVTTSRMLEQLGLSFGEARQLLELPHGQLIEAQLAVGPDTARNLHMFGPVADGIIIPLDPLESLALPGKRPPLLIGSNEDEAASFIYWDPGLQEPQPLTLERLFGQNAGAIWGTYRRYSSDMSEAAAWCRTLTEHLYTIGAIQLAESLVASGTQVWMYRLKYGGPLGAVHGYEGSLIHATAESVVTTASSGSANLADPYAVREEGYALARAMRAAWMHFVRHGDPNVEELPQWPVYGSDAQTMVLELACHVQAHLPAPAGIGVSHSVWRTSP
ncbi:para-nitrobenzyl esterase [Paenibacillus phyllosphaerae]|uniref:Carboxylic ester hydrolase n=1 Tax=Paenibacillus phyllosphaerae TaxID=274593 RepID=A0A7W5B1K6_9BACL|nr:para-nitrobenzyl esterase [Paenibacillus phyllosphaerae]